VPAGGGPRHFSFHPNGKFAYTNNELTSSVTAMSYDAKSGALTTLQTISTLPEGGHKGNSTAEVLVHPSGKFLYCSNRGHNSIAIFTIDSKTGKLTAAGRQGDQIKTPRNFCIDPAGKYLIAANQDSDSLVVFRIDQKTGALEPTGTRVELPRPVCVRFYTPAK
jgi:6-phosphogluconolactonase